MGYYADWTVAELRDVLRERRLRVSGRKAELIARLEAEDNRHRVCCVNCHKPARNMHVYRNGAACCQPCLSWHRFFEHSVRRTRSALRVMGYDEIDDIRQQAAEIYHNSETTHNLGFDESGLPYNGATEERHWSRLLNQLTPSHQTSNPFISGYHAPKLDDELVDEILHPLARLGVSILPQANLLREQLAHYLHGTFGQIPKDRLVSVMLQWSTPEYFFRNPEAWARSFSFVQEVVTELGDRAHFSEDGIRVIGSSNNLYEISPIRRPPFYRVTRIHEDQRMHICIDPIGAGSVVFGDILVSLALSLFEDRQSALRINTLHPHIFGVPRRHRNRNVNHLWQVALGRHLHQRRDENTEPEDNTWQHLLDRFQTNLDDWSGAEEEGV